MTTFVFLHVGHDITVNYFVKSILLSNPNAHIIQCSDLNTAKIPGVSEHFILNSNINNLMTFRLEIFSKLNLKHPAVYLDTDMIIFDQINIPKILSNYDVMCCKRYFDLNKSFITNFKGLNFHEYENKVLNDVFPFLACFTISKNYLFWKACYENLLQLDEKFHFWYGDQESIKNIIASNKFNIDFISESEFACLPEYISNFDSFPKCLHFKGPKRKLLMKKFLKGIDL
jgi:hypothetical protein